VHRSEDNLRGAEACLEHYAISERDTTEAAMQDAAWCALLQHCSSFGGMADGLATHANLEAITWEEFREFLSLSCSRRPNDSESPGTEVGTHVCQ
jgi:hypothetical protein